jgi:NADH:ubiquinone oxidoreductase subunit K
VTLTLTHYLVLGGILFCIGIFGAITRKNAIGILMSVELIFNAARWRGDTLGQLFALFVIAAAAAESVLGLAIILAIYRRRVVVNADEMTLMKN